MWVRERRGDGRAALPTETPRHVAILQNGGRVVSGDNRTVNNVQFCLRVYCKTDPANWILFIIGQRFTRHPLMCCRVGWGPRRLLGDICDVSSIPSPFLNCGYYHTSFSVDKSNCFSTESPKHNSRRWCLLPGKTNLRN